MEVVYGEPGISGAVQTSVAEPSPIHSRADFTAIVAALKPDFTGALKKTRLIPAAELLRASTRRGAASSPARTLI